MSDRLLHAYYYYFAAPAPVDVSNATPPVGTQLSTIVGWVFFCFGLIGAVAIGLSGAGIAFTGSGRGSGGQTGQHGIGFAAACVGVAIMLAAPKIVSAMQ